MLAYLADEWIVGLAQDWLNPREQRRLASCCRRLHKLVKQPLRIQICSSRSSNSADCCCLGGDLFVSRAIPPAQQQQDEADETGATHHRQLQQHSSAPPLTADAPEALEYNTPYYFWRFDYQEQCCVYLGRQLRQTQPRPPGEQQQQQPPNNNSSRLDYRYTLGLRPCTPNQYWKILPPDGASSEGGTVTPGRPLQLAVAGWDTRPGQVDSTDLHKLNAQVRPTHSGRPCWTWHTAATQDEKQNAESATEDLSFAYTTGHGRRLRPDGDLFLLFPSCPNIIQHNPMMRRRVKRSTSTTSATQIFVLETFAIPDISDRGAYLLYSPSRWKPHLAPSEGLLATTAEQHPPPNTMRSANGRSAMVDFSFWSSKGVLYFKAYCLPFALAIPIVALDRQYFEQPAVDASPPARPIRHLFDSFSARWGCIKYYMATAADVGEGCPLNFEGFLRGVTDHEDHVVERDEARGVVTIVMKLKQDDQAVAPVVDTSLVPDVPRDDSQRWKFFFSW